MTSFIWHSRPAWNSLRLKWSMRSDYMNVPTIACTTHFLAIRWKGLQELVAETLGVGMHIDSKFSLEMALSYCNLITPAM